MDSRLAKTSKFLSYILRHHPEAIGLELDRQGWVEVEVLLAAARRSGHQWSRELLEKVVAENDKQRFAFSSDGSKIRANQGHSIAVDLAVSPTIPPGLLYHGTATRFLDAIRSQGLIPKSRQHVHLSTDRKTAIAVGKRHGIPVVLDVRAGAMHEAGYPFYCSANGVWLCDRVPIEYLQFPTS